MVREPYHSERERADVADAEPAALGGSHGTVVKREASHARLPLSSFRPLYIAGVRVSRDHFLPPDPQAFLAAEPSTGRVVVISPTRAACETIELALGLNIDTVLEREHGGDIRRLAASGRGFGVVAGTGTGKTPPTPPNPGAHPPGPPNGAGANPRAEGTPQTPPWDVGDGPNP